MAAVSHLKIKKEAKVRDAIEKVMMRCSMGGTQVSVSELVNLLSSVGMELDTKEFNRLEKITDNEGYVEKIDFYEFAKKSPTIKEYIDGERTRNLDKAEIAFKAIDKDNSGYIDVGELGKLGKMDASKTNALMLRLDKDGDGKITLDEFRTLFKH